MARKLKRPDGTLFEEFVTAATYDFKNGKLSRLAEETGEGEFSGRFYFEYSNECTSPWYTVQTAPKWLLALYHEARNATGDTQ